MLGQYAISLLEAPRFQQVLSHSAQTVGRARADQVSGHLGARPMDGMGDPTDRRANFLGEINRVYGGTAPPPVGDLKGDYGFIVE
jgi:hypothetical protein